MIDDNYFINRKAMTNLLTLPCNLGIDTKLIYQPKYSKFLAC
ncbi:hypothetical protein SMITH_387 [Smithella sp. ME-1]|uniref:Uncharacterized protein n=1 Tax=hydrocarbon metagenome TaxID=938273 RepID=A0A0W8FQF5_9ZZZZ|nr:hypothetical protein SMITH_387 [Smithella sp. ME-1]